MAIGYARVEFVKRSQGKSACAKAAYNSRSEIHFDGNCAIRPQKYNWSSKDKPVHHEVILPSGVNVKFKNIETLWNTAESAETRSNSQVAIELVVALPDDKGLSKEDKVHLTKAFVEKYFIAKGLAAQIDVHAPERKIEITRSNLDLNLQPGMTGELVHEQDDILVFQLDDGRKVEFNPKEFTGFIEKEHNWHAHVLIPTRRFDSLGNNFGSKARDLMPKVAKGAVVIGNDWGKLWTDHQNEFFKSKGLSIRVDHTGLIPQTHLGPVRMRARALSLLEENNKRIEENIIECRNPEKILDKLTEKQSVFTRDDVERFLNKHIETNNIKEVREAFWKQKGLIELLEKNTGRRNGKFSSQTVVEEEKKILRLSAELRNSHFQKFEFKHALKHENGLNSEQVAAFNAIIKEGNLSCIQGYAGTGKSSLLRALSNAYAEQSFKIRAFGPDNATADVLKSKGFVDAENAYRFLFAAHAQNRSISKAKEVWVLDEAGKLGNKPLLEFLKLAEKAKVKVILAGDFEQMPSVERGGMFRNLCEIYSDVRLQNIQRQKNQNHLEIAKELAVGNASLALEKLDGIKRVIWADTKQEAIESLITRWAADTLSNPNATRVILAHTNNEVKVLNELVRDVRKQRGELNREEFCCETAQGRIFISVGDILEFRKNDVEKCLTNGLVGTLIDASVNSFTVAIKEENKRTRIVQFNPQEYHAYQLGYAKTFYRSQGCTVDQAYVLHNPLMHKEAFYVGLTRHVHDVGCFVSKDNGYCLADLKRQASKSDIKESTLNYQTYEDLEINHSQQEKTALIKEWKESSEFLFRLKGHTFDLFDQIKVKTKKIYQKIDDKKPNKEFFTHSLENEKTDKKSVFKIDSSVPDDLIQEKGNSNLKIENLSLSQEKKTYSILKNIEKLGSFEEKHLILKSYLEKQYILSKLYKENAPKEQIRAEALVRNELASKILEKFNKEDLVNIVGIELIEKITKQGHIYLENAGRQGVIRQNLQEELKEKIEPLLAHIFPEGPTYTTNTGFRFGSKGSLYVACKGAEAGLYYDFERKEGGNLIQLIRRELGFDKVESINWAKNFIGNNLDKSIPKIFKLKDEGIKNKEEWIAIRPDTENQNPLFSALSNGILAKYFIESSRHAYKDEDGRLLYYVLRLVDKSDASKKITPPLSYGYWKSNIKNVGWELKKPIQEKSSLYNLQLLKTHPTATVLVVEGEKTADKAMQYFPGYNMITISWSGGCHAADKADWAPLYGRNVVVWPDNDKAGIQAADTVCLELRKIGVKSLDLVDVKILEKQFPAKWDLADELPTNISIKDVQKILSVAVHKGIDPKLVLSRVSDKKGNGDALALIRANEILWRVDLRLRAFLENEMGGDFRKVNTAIINETTRIISKYNQKSELFSDFERRKNAQFAFYEASNGREPDAKTVNDISEIIQEFKFFGVAKNNSGFVINYIIDNKINLLVVNKSRNKVLSEQDYTKARQDVFKETQNCIVKLEKIENNYLEKNKEQSLQKGFDFRI